MAIAYPSPIPYIFLIVVLLIVLAVCIVKFPSLRTYRKRRNFLIYPAIVLLLSLISYQAYDASLGPAVIRYQAEIGENQFHAGQISRFDIFCENLGLRELNFYLRLESTNASFAMNSEQNYIQVNNTTIKIPFTFEAFKIHTTEKKPVFFTIDGNATSFEISFDDQLLATSSTREVQGIWNAATNSYVLTAFPGPCI